MSDERHNPRIRRVQLEKINPDEVVVYMTASSGAMGDAGAVEFYSIHFGQVLYFYGNVLNGLDMEEVDKHIPAQLSWLLLLSSTKIRTSHKSIR